MDDNELVEIENVEALSQERGLICTVSGVRVAVPRRYIDPSSEVRRSGDQGKLIMSAWAGRQARSRRREASQYDLNGSKSGPPALDLASSPGMRSNATSAASASVMAMSASVRGSATRPWVNTDYCSRLPNSG